MNYLYMGRASDLNVGNGKTVSIVGDTVDDWILNPNKKIFSNIKLKGIDYTEFHPENISEVLETENALVILDEIHAILHKNHRISESCTKHSVKGLCYRLSEFFRQVRKRHIDTRSSCQVFSDAHYQFRTLMQQQIECEKYRLEYGRLRKCDTDRCPDDHRHFIKRHLYRNFMYVRDLPLFDPEPYYDMYDSFEIVEGWVSYD